MSKIVDLTATSSPVDSAEFGANEGLNDRKYTRAEIVAGVVATHSNYVVTNDAAVALKASLAGPTFTGAVNLTGATTTVATPSAATSPTTKTYVDTADALLLPLAGGTMSGLLLLSGAPTNVSHATTKAYVDAADVLLLPLAGGTMTGDIVLQGAPTIALHPASKTYVDTADALALKNPTTIACAANPNYPAATLGDTLRVTSAGTIGGGPAVEVGDLLLCHTTSAGGTHASAEGSAKWIIIQTNVIDATETVKGVVELANSAEVDMIDLSAGTVVTAINLLAFQTSLKTVTNYGAGTHILPETEAGFIVLTDDTATVTINLPDATTLTNAAITQFIIMKGVAATPPTNAITITPAAGTVNTLASVTFAAANTDSPLICVNDGTNWYCR